MPWTRSVIATSLVSLMFCLFCAGSLCAQDGAKKYPLITRAVDETDRVTLRGNTRSEVRIGNDRGRVSDNLLMEHMYLQLKRSPEQQQAVQRWMNRLHDRRAPEYHHWLTADQIAEWFGPAEEDIQLVTCWLESHGLHVNVVYRPNGVIDFSGAAGAIRDAFHTEIHHIDVNGESHIANITDPQIPAALAPAVQGVVSLHDFRPRPLHHPRSDYTFWYGQFPYFALVPGDLATIYNMNPLYAQGIDGTGQTIVVVEDSNVYSTDDWYTFRNTFGLSQKFPLGTFQQIHPQPSNNWNTGGPCADPGVGRAEGEAILDAEWASAAAPNAAIVLASCANTNTNFGGYIAMQNLLTARGRPPGIVSISYSGPEVDLGTAGNAYIDELYETAVLRGVSVFVAAGDNGADASDSSSAAVSGINISGFASTPHNVAVGGTDFADLYLHQYWSYWSPTNGTYFDSALSYIPEIPWNDSCASQTISSYLGFPAPYGANGLCNSPIGEAYFLTTVAGSGGPSACASGTPNIYGVVGGTCQGYKKPLYQRIVAGNPRDGVRDIPDVSLFAANGLWSHYFVFCFSDAAHGGYPCAGSPVYWSGAGGTSFSSPIMAGVQAMINQAAGGYQGNPNYVYYLLGALQYDFNRAAACNSTLGNQINPNCIFNDVTLGDIDINCLPMVDSNGNIIGTFNCYIPNGTNGVLSLSNSTYLPAYPATQGWDFATGLGTVNAYNLVKNWPGVRIR